MDTDTLKKEVLRLYHDFKPAKYFEVAKHLAKLRDHFHWVKCRQGVENWYRKMVQKNDAYIEKKKKKHTLRQGEPLMEAAREYTTIDELRPLPEAQSGNQYMVGNQYGKLYKIT